MLKSVELTHIQGFVSTFLIALIIKIQMKEIAERAHVGRKTLYRYFDSKEKIVKYVAESLMDRFAQEIHVHNEDGLTLKGVTYAFFVFINNNRAEFSLLKKARLLSFRIVTYLRAL